MKKTIKVILTIGLLVSFVPSNSAYAAEKPTVVSFTMTPDTVDVATTNTVVSFDLTVSSATGIFSTQSLLTLTDGANHSLTAMLLRTDSPVNSALSTVKFHGSLTVPPFMPNGVYSASATPISALNASGNSGYATDTLFPTSTSKVFGAEDSLLVRNGGDLNFALATFTGPTYDKTLGNTFINKKYNSVAAPVLKVGESYNPSDYYELLVPSLALSVKSNTPSICSADGPTLKFVAQGSCSFTVFTPKTLDYQYFKSDQTLTITAGRTKPTYFVGTIPTQSSSVLPLVITGPTIFSPFGLIVPVSSTPTVCYTTGNFINVISGGTCTVNYSTPGDATFLASDVYPLTFQITRATQSVSFTIPTTVSLASKSLSLSATASSGAAVTFQSNSPDICSVTGNSLNLLKAGACQIQAQQIGTTTIAPATSIQSITVVGISTSAKKLICVKNGKSKTVVGTKCPSGYKIKK